MIKMSGPFPLWIYRIAPLLAVVSGVVMGASIPEPAQWMQGGWALGVAAVASGALVALCNIAVCNNSEGQG